MDWLGGNDWDVDSKSDSLNRELFGRMPQKALLKSKDNKVKKRKRSNEPEHKTSNKFTKSETSSNKFTPVKKRKRSNDPEHKTSKKFTKSETSSNKSTPVTYESTIANVLTKKQKRRLKEKNRIKRKKEERLAHQFSLSSKNTDQKAFSQNRNKIEELSFGDKSADCVECSNRKKKVKEQIEGGDFKNTSVTAVTSSKIKKKSSSKKNKYKHLAHTDNIEVDDNCTDRGKDKEISKQFKHDRIPDPSRSNSEVTKPENIQNIKERKRKWKSQIKIDQNPISKKRKNELKIRGSKDQSDTGPSTAHTENNLCDDSSETMKHIKLKTPSKSNEKNEDGHPHLILSNRHLKKLSTRDRLQEKLDAARFRFLNQQLYTTNGKEALELFHDDDDAFKVYHRGFQTQVAKWPVNPLDAIIKSIEKRNNNIIVADLGCGEAKLAQSIPQKVHSFDLVALNKYVTVCDISKLPLKHDSVDIVVFCLSLMGTNLADYLSEANRILKKGGIMKIAEVTSRFRRLNSFIAKVEEMGFLLLSKDSSNTMFVMMDFEKKSATKRNIPSISLDPCLYKRR